MLSLTLLLIVDIERQIFWAITSNLKATYYKYLKKFHGSEGCLSAFILARKLGLIIAVSRIRVCPKSRRDTVAQTLRALLNDGSAKY